MFFAVENLKKKRKIFFVGKQKKKFSFRKQRHLSDPIVDTNHRRTHSNTHTKFHENRSNRLGGVKSQST